MILVTYSNALEFLCFRTYQINPHKDSRIEGETRKYGDFIPLETEQSRAWECTLSYDGRMICITDELHNGRIKLKLLFYMYVKLWL
jgi:hypothetical protein